MLIRVGHATGQIMVVLVLGYPIMPSKNNFVKALLKIHPEITTMVLNINDKDTSMVLGDREQVILRHDLPHLAQVLLSGEPCADREAVRQGHGVRGAHG